MVLLKKVINANPGTADLVGGNDWDKLADFFNDIDTSEIPRINNLIEFRSGKANIRDGSNAFNVLLKSATQTGNRDFTIPALIGNDSPAMLALTNNFTALQQVTLDSDILLSLYRPVNTTNTLNSLGFYQRNSSNTQVEYSQISNKLMVNTAGIEDGKLVFYVRKAGVLTEVMSIDKNGLLTVTSVSTGGGTPSAILADANIFTNVNTISLDAVTLFKLYRPANTANNTVGIDYQHRNSTPTQTTFARTAGKLITNTAAAEVGEYEVNVMKAGTLTKVWKVDQNGQVTAGSGQNIFAGGVLLNLGTAVTTASTSSEFDMLNYSVPANMLGLNGLLRVEISGYLLQNQATGTDFTIRIKFGGTTIWQDDVAALGQSSGNRTFLLRLQLGNKNSTSSQGMHGEFKLQDTTAPAIGEGSITDDEKICDGNFRSSTGTSSANTTSAQTLAVTMTHSVNNSLVATSVQRRLVEFLPGA